MGTKCLDLAQRDELKERIKQIIKLAVLEIRDENHRQIVLRIVDYNQAAEQIVEMLFLDTEA